MSETEYFATRLARHRRAAGLTQEMLAVELNVSRVTIANYETAVQEIALSVAIALARRLSFSLDGLRIHGDGAQVDIRKMKKRNRIERLKKRIEIIEGSKSDEESES